MAEEQVKRNKAKKKTKPSKPVSHKPKTKQTKQHSNSLASKAVKSEGKKGQKKRPSQSSRRASKTKTHPKKAKNPLYNLLMNILFYAFLLFMVGASIMFAASNDANKSILGYRFFGVLSDSMVPRDPKTQKGGFRSGDIIIVKNISGKDAEVGDIITFHPSIDSKTFLTHRVKEKLDKLGEKKGTFFVTQGDANDTEDMPIEASQVVGEKVLVIPKVGGLIDFVRQNIVVSAIFVLSLFGSITVFRYYILNR